MSSGTEAHDPSAPYDGAPPQRRWGGGFESYSAAFAITAGARTPPREKIASISAVP